MSWRVPLILVILLQSGFSLAGDLFVAPDSRVAEQLARFEFTSPLLESRAMALSRELRCPQCQNQNLLESNSPIAMDLRLKVYQQVNQGKSDDEIKSELVSRYGEFVLYRPEISSQSVLLWLLPLLFLLLMCLYLAKQLGVVKVSKKR